MEETVWDQGGKSKAENRLVATSADHALLVAVDLTGTGLPRGCACAASAREQEVLMREPIVAASRRSRRRRGGGSRRRRL